MFSVKCSCKNYYDAKFDEKNTYNFLYKYCSYFLVLNLRRRFMKKIRKDSVSIVAMTLCFSKVKVASFREF